jgi:hypothetical protein
MKPTPSNSMTASITANMEPRKRAEETAGTIRFLAVPIRIYLFFSILVEVKQGS